MTKREYAEAIAELVNGVVKENIKTNGVVMTGIAPKAPENKVVPCAYIDDAYAHGAPIEEVAEQIMNTFKTKVDIPDLEYLNDYEQVKDKLILRMVNKQTPAEVKRSAKGYGFSNLIFIPFINVMQDGYVKVTQQLVDKWGVTAKKVIDDAMKNTKARPFIVKGMSEMLMGFSVPDDPMVVVTSDSSFGAIGAIVMREQLRERFPNGYIVIPSSVHEVIVISNEYDPDFVKGMIGDVNGALLKSEEILSNRPYVFAA